MPLVPLSKAELSEALDRTRNRAKSLRRKAAKTTERVVGTLATVGGGAATGYLIADHGDRNLLGVELGWAIGGLATVAGLADALGRQSGMLERLGGGMLAGQACVETIRRRGGSIDHVGALPGRSVSQAELEAALNRLGR